MRQGGGSFGSLANCRARGSAHAAGGFELSGTSSQETGRTTELEDPGWLLLRSKYETFNSPSHSA